MFKLLQKLLLGNTLVVIDMFPQGTAYCVRHNVIGDGCGKASVITQQEAIPKPIQLLTHNKGE